MKTDPRPKKKIGIGGVCSVLKKFLHPFNLVRNHEVWRNIELDERVEDLIIIGYKERESGCRSNKTKKNSLLFRHDNFPNQELYCVSHRYAHCYKDGGEEFHFNLDLSTLSKKSSADDENKKDENTQKKWRHS